MTTTMRGLKSAVPNLRNNFPSENVGGDAVTTSPVHKSPSLRSAPRGAADRRARRELGARLRGTAASAASCGIVAFYITWRFGLMKSLPGHMRSLAASCRLPLLALSGSVLSLRLPLLPSPPPSRSSRHTAASSENLPSSSQSSPGPSASRAGNEPEGAFYSVHLIALPPRRSEAVLAKPPAVHVGMATAMATAEAAAAASATMALGTVGVAGDLSGCINGSCGPPTEPSAVEAGSAAVAAGEKEREQHHHQQGQQQEPLPDVPLEVHHIDLRRSAPAAAAVAAAAASKPAGAVVAALSLLAADLGSEEVIGLDAEWEPELQAGVRHRISVVQLACASRCWILQPGGGGGAAAPCFSAQQDGQDRPSSSPQGSRPVPLEPEKEWGLERLQAGWLPREVVQLLSNPRVIKAGVGIQEDVRRLERDFDVQVRGAVDVRLVAQRVAPHCLAGGGSLQALSSALLGRQLDKSAQRSHWGSNGQLDERQIAYAAHDAWLSRELLCELHSRHRRIASFHMAGAEGSPLLPPPPPVSPGTPLLLPLPVWNSRQQQHRQQQQQAHRPLGNRCQDENPLEQEGQQQEHQQSEGQQRQSEVGTRLSVVVPPPLSILEFAMPFLDVFNGIKGKRVEKVLGPGSQGKTTASVAAAAEVVALEAGTAMAAGRGLATDRREAASGSGTGSGCDRTGGGGPPRQKEMKLPTRKSVLYENCRLLAPDGAVLCTCGAKKVAWYIQRGLARVVSEHPTTIQLIFEPRGRGHADDEYYLSDKENRCCVCGSAGEYLRHSVVPHCYRQHFPPSMKSHLSHDIVLMCPHCHKTCSVADQRRMEALGRTFQAPLGSATAAKFRHDSSLGVVRSAGRALANPKVVIPPARRQELEDLLRRHFDVELVDEALVRQAADVDPRMEDENWRSHAELVVRALGGRDKLETFVRGWRQHFLDTMRPRFMPPHWRVDARVANSSAVEDDEETEEEAAADGEEDDTQE